MMGSAVMKGKNAWFPGPLRPGLIEPIRLFAFLRIAARGFRGLCAPASLNGKPLRQSSKHLLKVSGAFAPRPH